jgi:type I restriction enzyme, S subunit
MIWPSSSLGNLVECDGGVIQTGPFGSQLHQSDYVSEGIPVIMPKDIVDGRVSTNSVARVSEETATRLSRHQLVPRTIVLPRRGEITKRAFIREEQAGWLCGTGCVQISVHGDHLIPEFLYYYMEQAHVVRWLEQHAVGTTMLNLNTEIVAALPVSCPPPPVQKRIARTLSVYDDLIDNNRRRMALLEEAARQLYREWFVRFRFPGHEHTSITNGVPQGWERAAFETAIVLQRGFDLPIQAREDGDVPIYGSTGVNGFHSKARVVGPGVVTGRSGTLGEVHYVPGDFWPLNTALWVKEFRRATPLFSMFLMREMDLRQYNGGVSVPTLDRKTVHRAEILIPPKNFIRSFDEFAAPLFQQIDTLTAVTAKLRAARDLLLPRLMSGEIAV